MLIIKKGHARGGDSHKGNQYNVVLSGKVEYRAIHNEYEFIRELKEGDIIKTKAGDPHIFIAIEDSLMFEWGDGTTFERKYYAPYRRIIEEKLGHINTISNH